MNLSIPAVPHPLALLLCLGALALGLALYLTRYPALAPRKRYLLLAVRTITLLALLFASLAPVLRYSSASKERNRVLVLVDHSGSMEVRDGDATGRTRREVADSAALAVARDLGARYDVRLAPFDAALGPIGRPSSWKSMAERRGAGETALGDALREALDRIDPDSLAAILVLSDGAVNRGEDPERVLESSVPAFALTVGSPSDPPTTGIAGVDVPGEVVMGKPSVLTVTIRHGARSATRGIARLSDGARELGRAPFTVSGSGSTVRAPIPFTITERGKHFLTVKLDSLPGDPIRQNKRRLVAVTARPAKHGVPLLASSWDWDLRSLQRGVEEDTSWAIQRLLPVGSGAVTTTGGGNVPLAQALRESDVAVARLDARTLTPERSAELLRFAERGGGILLWIDPTDRVPSQGPLARALGLEWREIQAGIGPTSLELTAAGRAHEVSLLGGDAATATQSWHALPPVQIPAALSVRGDRLATLLVARYGAETLPLLLVGRVGAGRVAVLNAAGVYRWGLTASGLAGGAGVEPSFFGGLVTWLSLSADDRPVRIAAPDLTPAERAIPVRVSLANPALSQGAKARVSARRIDARAQAQSAGLGSAQGDFAGQIALSEGIYVLQGRVERGGRLLGQDSVRVAVGEQGIEFESLAAEPDVLERLASRSGGAAAPIDRPRPVLAKLRSPGIAKARMMELDLFHNVALFVVLVLGATAEWILRKRFHLL